MASEHRYFGQILQDCEGETRLSRWWAIIFAFVLLYGFTVLITITAKAYKDKPPIPEIVVNTKGQPLFTGDDIRRGQQIFLINGLMSNGTVFGHGSYLGPDFPALTLHQTGTKMADMLSYATFGKLYSQLDEGDKGSIEALTPEYMRENLFDPATGRLVFNQAQEAVFLESPAYWREYLSRPVNNGGLKANLITNPEELRQLSAYFNWIAWASVANRPGEKHSYTNNFPYDPLVGNSPVPLSYIWSAISILFLLGGIALVLYILGRHHDWSWHAPDCKLSALIPPRLVSESQGRLVKFVVVISVLLFAQTLVGGAVAHYRADPGNFYGFDLSVIFPSDLVRTWHLQLMIFWVASGFVTGGLFLSRILGGHEYKSEKNWVDLLYCAFALVIFGSLICDWIGLAGLWPRLSFWLGSQGWEYLEIGRLWQYLLIIGLILWFILVLKNTWPAMKNKSSKPLAIMFLIAAFGIPFFYLPAIFYDGQTHYTVVDTWRFWIIHLWVEGFFELFATAMVALVFIELGFVTKTAGLRVILLDGILTLMGGIIGTGHHWYFSGQTTFNMTLSGWFSALEVVPLVILCVEAGGFIKTTRNVDVQTMAHKFRWPILFFMSVGFWNFVGAGVFGFLINMPIVSYYEIGTYLTPNHSHSAMFGVFGLLSLGLCVMVLRQANTEESWKKVEKYIAVSWWGFNIGLAGMLVLSLFPGGIAQLADVLNNGYWHARSPEFTNSETMAFIGWLRMPGDLVFIIFGAIPFLIAALKTWAFYWKESKTLNESGEKAPRESSPAEA